MTRQSSGLMSDIYAEEISVLNSAIASTVLYEDEITKEALSVIRQFNQTGATTMNTVLHSKLKDELMNILSNIQTNMIARFAVILPYDEMQSMLMSEDTLTTLQVAGRCMPEQYTQYSYKLGEKVIIRLNCHGSKEMPSILFPDKELTNFSEDFIDLVRPLYLITKSWIDVIFAFKTILMLIEDTRELNFFVPWLRLIIPDREFTNEFNAAFRVSQWLNLDREKNSTIDMITRQIRYILKNEYTSKRTWMPSELVHMVRQGEELITQYNIMKSVSIPNINLRDKVEAEVIITTTDHPTIKWAAEASTHRTMKEANRLKAIDENKRRKYGEIYLQKL